LGGHLLQDAGDALQAHAGVDVGRWEGFEVAVLLAVELREDQVPELQQAAALSGFRKVLDRPRLGGQVGVDLGTGTAGTGGAHGPEVILFAEAHDALRREVGDVLPKLDGLLIVAVDGDPQAVLVHLEDVAHELPSPGDGLLLEVTAEGEVAEHLEERMVTGRVSTRSRSPVRKHFCRTRVRHLVGKGHRTEEEGLNWFMPALANRGWMFSAPRRTKAPPCALRLEEARYAERSHRRWSGRRPWFFSLGLKRRRIIPKPQGPKGGRNDPPNLYLYEHAVR
jgi:hypothetical protein